MLVPRLEYMGIFCKLSQSPLGVGFGSFEITFSLIYDIFNLLFERK